MDLLNPINPLSPLNPIYNNHLTNNILSKTELNQSSDIMLWVGICLLFLPFLFLPFIPILNKNNKK